MRSKIPHGKGGTEAAIEWLGESVSRLRATSAKPFRRPASFVLILIQR